MNASTHDKPRLHSRLAGLCRDKRGTATMSMVGLTVVGILVGGSTVGTVKASTDAFHLGEASVQAHSSLAVEAQNEQIKLMTVTEDGDPIDGMRSQFDTLDREGVDHLHTVGYREQQASHLAGYDAAGNAMWVDRLGSQHHRFSDLAASGNMAMGLDEGVIWSWGQNNVYQLGVGDTADRHEPTRVTTDVVFEELVQPTDTAACGIEAETRNLWCWGENEWEQLGAHDEVGEYLIEPTQVTDFAIAEGEKKIALTPNTLHVIDSANRLRSQGENAGTETGDSVPFNTVVTNAQNVAADVHTALVVHGGGQLSAFTLNGLGAPGQPADSGTETASASFGGFETATILPAGQLAEDQGELTPVDVPHPENGTWSEAFIAPNDSELYASTAYATDTTNQLKAWGNNVRGQVGVAIDEDIERTPVQVATGVQTMVASGSSAAALRTNADVITWGHTNGVGRSGDTVPATNGVTGATALSVSTGDRQAFCATVPTGTDCWGNDDHHQVMADGVNRVDAGRFAPYTKTVVGDEFVCASDASLLTECWGRAELGETARGITGLNQDPAPIARRGDHPVVYRGIHTGAQDYHNGSDQAGASD